jgi:hypothetical protein
MYSRSKIRRGYGGIMSDQILRIIPVLSLGVSFAGLIWNVIVNREKIPVRLRKSAPWLAVMVISIVALVLLNINAEPPCCPKVLLQKISFDKLGSPKDYGWRILDSAPITFTNKTDGYVGSYLSIDSTASSGSDAENGMETTVEPNAVQGDSIEYIARYVDGNTAAVYALVDLRSQSGVGTSKGWLKFYVGPNSYRKSNNQEWVVYVSADKLGGEWVRLPIDLLNVVENTFGNDGWKYDQIEAVRTRGDLDISSISIFK